jgi:hypothetical protein
MTYRSEEISTLLGELKGLEIGEYSEPMNEKEPKKSENGDPFFSATTLR